MAYDEAKRRAIYDKTAGRCHICHKKLALKNYGCQGSRGAWEVDHGVARARGGGDSLKNLLAACCDCNREKSSGTTRRARRRAGHGKTRAPMSLAAQEASRAQSAVVLGGLGALIGGSVGGPPGAWLGGIAGSTVGAILDPDE